MIYTLEYIRKNNLIIFEGKTGSKAYGTALSTSDVDIRGIFIQPLEDILQWGYKDQVSDELNDVVFYELKRFFNLLDKNNPNILEILNLPKDCIIFKDPLYDIIKKNVKKFITKKCRWTFAGYAVGQIKKARGYNKKMNWEESQMTPKTVLDFCYILFNGKTILLHKFLQNWNWNRKALEDDTQQDFGLAKIDHTQGLYAMYKLPNRLLKGGIVSDPLNANDVQLMTILKETKIVAYLTFNKDAYSIYCKKYKEYKTWLNERNEDRFKMNKEHGKSYDSKNMSHCIRLLDMAIEIAETGNIVVRRSKEHIDLLMKIRRGEMEFNDIINMAEDKIKYLDEAFDNSDIPDKVQEGFAGELELQIRKKRYGL